MEYNPYKTLCAETVHLSLPTLSGKHVESSLAGHSCPAALCWLAIPQRSR